MPSGAAGDSSDGELGAGEPGTYEVNVKTIRLQNR